MKRTGLLWSAFAVCLAVVLAAMAWVSGTALRLDEAEARARQQAALEENVRLALWRMDSALAPLLAQESARPYFTYHTFLPLERAYGRMFNRARPPGEMLVPSPLLSEVSPCVRVHFQFDPDGRLTGPRAPAPNEVGLAVPRYLSQDAVRKAEQELGRIKALTDRTRLMALLPESAPARLDLVAAPWAANVYDFAAEPAGRNDPRNRSRAAVEFSQRGQAIVQNTAATVQSQAENSLFEPLASPTDIGGVLMAPRWLDGELILARRVTVGGQQYVQGCLLDWPAIQKWLRETVQDLLPEADLEPVADAPAEEEARLLAALPVRLVPGSIDPAGGGPASPIHLTLFVAWACVLVAAGAVAGLLAGVIRLSERRAAFVSAVTHELRTPLTTFHMYTEMLTAGMVPDADRQQDYLKTLRVEASRLSHLVENVLAYARLERGRTSGRVETLSLARLIDPIRSRLADRAAQAGMELAVEAGDGAREAKVRANPSAVEQILFNLVDNACKYAAGAADKRIHLSVQRAGDGARIAVRDHGPGISGPAARRLFRPFSKSAREAANSAPGVGLGLALSHRLAGDMGGRLDLDHHGADGACFVLSLPAAE